MLTVYTAPRVEPDPQHGWQIVLWFGEPFDYSIPFREALAEIVKTLEQSASVLLDLPPYLPDEDFVEGTFRFGEALLYIYYEHSLGYLAVMSADRAPLEDVAARVFRSVHVG